MMEAPRLLVYKASAGSGKTFTLAARYIGHLAEDPRSYRRILAVTFTNKATAEMKERIIGQLRGIAACDPASGGMLREVMAYTGKTGEEIRAAAAEALTGITHDYSRFRIETIDSFFQSVIRNLARELELGTSLNVDLDNEKAIGDAVDALIDMLPLNLSLRQWIIGYIEEQLAEDRSWKIIGNIKKFGMNIFDESFIEKGETLREKLRQPDFTRTLKRDLRKMRTDALEGMKRLASQYFDTLQSNGIESGDLKVNTYYQNIRQGKLRDEIYKTNVGKCNKEGSEDFWTSKKNERRDEIIALARRTLIPLLKETEQARGLSNYIVNSCSLTANHLNTLHLLSDITTEVRLQSREKNRFLLSDTNALLHSLIREGDASFVYEKTGTTVDVVMIDEFQDTSRMQWENFRILLEENLSQHCGSLVVGDIKQSIYRWRNGDWSILASLVAGGTSFRVEPRRLGTNWRSETRIVNFCNDFFTSACTVLCDQYRADHGREFTALQAAYDDVRQRPSKESEAGYVSVSFIRETGDAGKELQLELLAEEVLRLTGQGVKPEDITILVRNKKRNIPLIAGYFKDNGVPYPIVSDEAFRLDASPAVCMLMDSVRYLCCPYDTITLSGMALCWQQRVLGSGLTADDILMSRDKESLLPEEFCRHKSRLRQLPLFELLNALYTIFRLHDISGQDAYVCAFFDEVTEYIRTDTPDLPAFITYWDEELRSKTVPSGEIDGIRIMSIHKSKGLEFHTVLVPLCDWNMEVEVHPHLIWCSPDSAKREFEGSGTLDRLDLIPADYSGVMRESAFSESYIREKEQLWIDNLNLLYVAFTRAAKNLIVWGRWSKDNLNTTAGLMHRSLMNMGALTAGNEDTYTVGAVCLSGGEDKGGEATLVLPARTGTVAPRYEFRQSGRSAAFVNDGEETDRDRYISRGLLLHNVFASIRHASELDESLTRLRFEGVIETDGQEEEIRGLASRALQHPQVRGWYDGSWQVLTERSIIFPGSDGKAVTRRPDRVMMRGGVTVVVDFKFGVEREEHYSQVREYMSLLSGMGCGDVRGYLWYVFSNKVSEVTACI